MVNVGDIVEVKAYNKELCDVDGQKYTHTVKCLVLVLDSEHSAIVRPPMGYQSWPLIAPEYGYHGPDTQGWSVPMSSIVAVTEPSYTVGEMVEVPAMQCGDGDYAIGPSIGWSYQPRVTLEIAAVQDQHVILKLSNEVPGGYDWAYYDLTAQKGRFWRMPVTHIRKIASAPTQAAPTGACCARCGDHNPYQSPGFTCYSCRQDPWRMSL